VVLRYTQVLGREGDALRLRYAIGPRTNSRALGGDAAPQDNFSLKVTAPDEEAFGTPYSPTHDVTTTRRGGRLTVSVPASATGDLDLLVPLRRGLVGTSVLTHASAGEDGYYMLLLAPPDAPAGTVIPRNLTLVVDVSGSMSGAKLEQAKAALSQALGALGPQDQFRLIAFSSGITEFRTGLAPATTGNVAAAQEFVANLSAGGGTNIEGALDVALRQPGMTTGRVSLVVFMTDGLPSVGQTQPDQIAEAAGGRIGQARIFTVGVGTDVNTYLLDRLAKEGRGSATYVAPNADMEVAVGGLLGRLRYPALTNLRIVGSPAQLVDMQPAQLPDLFYGEELVVFGRYHGTGTGNVVIEGERNGRRERFTAQAQFTARQPDNGFVAPLWASRRIGELTRTARLEGASPAIIEEIRQLGLRYGLLTEYTSFLVLEPGAQPAAVPPSLQGGRDAAKSMSGQAAFARAEASSRQAEVKSLAAADEAANRGLANAPGAPGERRAETRRIAGRVFVERDGTWTDMTYVAGGPTVAVAPFSPAYFELVRALPELSPWLGAGDQVIIAGGRISIRIVPSGLTAWRSGQLAATARDFRQR
ncbi:MAG TPA: VWA domain-containing protein, partial [Gemmatimonadales bacterium]|nr:VWA domain-containing protein [Gemmatimonadales bacterium]